MNIRQNRVLMKSKHIIYIFSLVIVILVGYWIKCQIGIDFFGSCSLSNAVPFKHLQRNKILAAPNPGVILTDSFESSNIISSWSELWMREKGKVTHGYDSNGLKDSPCLFINSKSKKSWAYSHYKLIEVQEGDIFSFKGFVKIKGDDISAYAGIAAFDEKQTAIKWNYIQVKVVEQDKWIAVEKRFTISDEMKYIQFRLTGVGVGEYRFDDIIFRKEEGRAEGSRLTTDRSEVRWLTPDER
jgi:hypothetical protein